MNSLIGRKLGVYRVLEQIGTGGQGHVYRARDERLDWDVAIKVLDPELLTDQMSRQRFEVEARAMAKVEHPNIADFHGFDHQDGIDFLVMEYVPGELLSQRITRGPLPERDVLRFGIQLAEGLAAAHARNVLHRDLKPSNLKITPDERLKIIDFGLAKLTAVRLSHSITVPDTVPGTPHCVAPERMRGEAEGPPSDVYAVGIVLYSAATGLEPVEFAALDGSVAPLSPRKRNPRLSRALDALILRCMDERPGQRPTAAQLALALKHIAREEQVRREWVIAVTAVGVIGVALAAQWWIKTTEIGIDDRIRSWAVLPFTVSGPDSSQHYLAEGLAVDLLEKLSQVPSVRVISWESSRRYVPGRLSTRRIAQELGTQGLVTGEMRLEAGQWHVRVHLIDARTDRELATKKGRRSVDEVWALQSLERQVVREVARRAQVKPGAPLPLAEKTDPAVLEDYARARYHWNRRPGELMRSIEYFERAIRADSTFALGHAGLADAWAAVGLYALRPPLEARLPARAAARRALALDNELSSAHVAMAIVLHNLEWDWEGAEAEYRTAISLNENDAAAHHGLAHLLAQLGRHEEAWREIHVAISLNPRALATVLAVPVFHYFARDPAAALDTLSRIGGQDSSSVLRHRLTATVLDQLGRHDEAMAELVRAVQLQGQPALAEGMRRTYAAAGMRPALELLIGALVQKRSLGAYEPAEHIAELYARIGDVEKAFEWLEIAFREHDTELNRLKVDPLFDPLRRDPRFADLMKRVGFPS